MAQIPKFGGSKKMSNFLTSQKLPLYGPANGQLVTYSKIRIKVSRTPLATPMDWFLVKWVDSEYPLSHRKCPEKCNFFSDGPRHPLSVSHPQKKMVPSCSPVICPPKTPKPCWPLIAPSSRKLWFSEGPIFWQKYSNGPGVAKSWHMSKVTIRCHKWCVKLSWVQIWQKNSNGKCPKLPIRNYHLWCY